MHRAQHNGNNSGLLITFLVFLIPILSVTQSSAQANDYRRLAFKANRPNLYVTMFSLPGNEDKTVQLTATFRLSYGLLSFKKWNKSDNHGFYAVPQLNIKIYKSPNHNLQFKEDVSLVDLESVTTVTWRDTVFAKNYKATTKSTNFATGFIQIPLKPGYYTYLLQFNQTESNRKISATRNIQVHPYQEGSKGEIIFVAQASSDQSNGLNLVNRGGDVSFGDNFQALVLIPHYTSDNQYKLRINRIKIRGKDTTVVETVYEQKITSDQIIESVNPQLFDQQNMVSIKLAPEQTGFNYALVEIPNHTFREATYKMELLTSDDEQPIAQKVYQSRWFDKPVSLYSTDMAIEMLRYIADESTIDKVGQGSSQQEQRALKDFWKEKDPTPNTVFNELKAEYYQRIDYAYNHYSAQRVPGFETDQGRIYILYGPPKDIKRVYPRGKATREVWIYPNRQFVFKATSGFGNFILINNK